MSEIIWESFFYINLAGVEIQIQGSFYLLFL